MDKSTTCSPSYPERMIVMNAPKASGGRAIGTALLALLVSLTLGVSSLSPGPDGTVPGPERYRFFDGREGLQTQAAVLNRSHSAALIDDPRYRGPVMEIVFAKTPTMTYTERYDQYGFLLSKSTITLTIDRLIDENGNIVANSIENTRYRTKIDPAHPLYSYPLGRAAAPSWLTRLAQA